MTISEAENNIIKFFTENEIFVFEKNFQDVLVVSDNRSRDRAIFEKAFENLEAIKLVHKIVFDNKACYVLQRPLACVSQTVELSYSTIMGIAGVINDVVAKVKDKSAMVDALNIKEKDIQNLIILAMQHANPSDNSD